MSLASLKQVLDEAAIQEVGEEKEDPHLDRKGKDHWDDVRNNHKVTIGYGSGGEPDIRRKGLISSLDLDKALVHLRKRIGSSGGGKIVHITSEHGGSQVHVKISLKKKRDDQPRSKEGIVGRGLEIPGTKLSVANDFPAEMEGSSRNAHNHQVWYKHEHK